MEAGNELRREFLRSVYDAASDTEARKAILDGYRTVALKTIASGKTLIGAAGAGVSSQFEQIQGFSPEVVIKLVDWARDYISEATITEALARIPRHGVTLVHTSFAGLRG